MATSTPLFIKKIAPIRKRLLNGSISANATLTGGTPGTDMLLLYTVPAGYQLRIVRIEVKLAGSLGAPTAATVRFWGTDGAGYAIFDEVAITTTPVSSGTVPSLKVPLTYPDGSFLDAGESLYASASVVSATNQYSITITAGLVPIL